MNVVQITTHYVIILRLCLQYDYGDKKKQCLGPQNNPESTTRCADMKTYKISQLD